MRDVTLLSYGMGVESSAVLVRWCFDATARPCPLNELIGSLLKPATSMPTPGAMWKHTFCR